MAKLLAMVVLSTLWTSSAVHGKRRSSSDYNSRLLARGKQLLLTRHHRGTSDVPGPTEQLEEWQDHGKSLSSKLSAEDLLALGSRVTTEVYSKELHDFISNRKSRFVANEGNADTAEYIKKQLETMGLVVSEQTMEDDRIQEQYVNLLKADPNMDLNKAAHKNIIGFLKGGDLAHEVVLMGAHYDSVNWEDTKGSAPGVDDNGSGSALMLAIARVLSAGGETLRPRRSVLFVAFNAEEEGLVGSEHFAKNYRKDYQELFGDLKAAFIADEVAWPGRKGERQAIFETSGTGDGTNAMVDTLAKMAVMKNSTSSAPGDGLGNGIHNFVVNYNGFGSDHMSFLNEGLPAVLLIERDDDYHADKFGHSARDTFAHVDMSYGASMTRLALRTVATFANPAASPTAVAATTGKVSIGKHSV